MWGVMGTDIGWWVLNIWIICNAAANQFGDNTSENAVLSLTNVTNCGDHLMHHVERVLDVLKWDEIFFFCDKTCGEYWSLLYVNIAIITC